MSAMVNSEVVVLTVSKYSFLDKETGELRNGVTVHYVSDLTAGNSGDKRGAEVTKANLPVEQMANVKEVPAFYVIGYDLGADSKGKAKLNYKDLLYSRPLVLKV